MQFHKLSLINGSFSITHKKPFPPDAPAFKQETVNRVFEFAYSMTFGAAGEHRDHRTEGSLQRKNGEIFANTFQGKLAECAVCNLFYKLDPSVMPDFTVAKLGVWDSADVIVNNKKISVKSTKSYGNLLLLEQHDWDENGNYIPNSANGSGVYDYIILIRINPSCEEIMRRQKWLYKDSLDKDRLRVAISENVWNYDFAGYITHGDLKTIIREGFIIRKGELLNGSTAIDADNYYIQAGDMFDVKNLLDKLKKIRSKFMPIYNSFGRIQIDDARIDETCNAYFKWKDLNTYIQNNSHRGINMPDAISEPMGCYCLGLLWNRGDEVGDAYDPVNNKKVEFKATSRFEGDLSSFGPKCYFDDLVFLRFKLDDNLLYIYDLKINSEEFGKYPANSAQTIQEQKNQGRRPHISLQSMFVEAKGLKPDVIFDIRRCRITEDNRK